MVEIVFYASRKDRADIIKLREAQGMTMLSDDFVSMLGFDTTGDSGRLTFDFRPDQAPTAEQTRLKLLESKIQDNSATFAEVKEYIAKKLLG